MKLFKILTCCLALAAVGCNESDIAVFDSPLVDGGNGTLNNSGKSVSALEFSWDAIPDVYQYGYQLIDPDRRTVRQGVIKYTSIRFERLEPDTQYTLEVEAYGSNGVATKRFTLVAKTDAIVQLATPDVASMTVTSENGVLTLAWSPVSNAAYYEYTLYGSNGEVLKEDTTEMSSVSFNNLPAGDYTITLIAKNDDEAFIPSEPSSYTFTREKEFLYDWAVKANTVEDAEWGESYDGAVLLDKPVTVEGYDGYFIIKSWLGVEGYDVKISFDAETDDVTLFTPISKGIEGTPVKSGYATVPATGSGYYAVQMYIGSGYSYANASKDEGYVLLSGYFYESADKYYWMYYEISWGGDDDGDAISSVTVKTALNDDWGAYYDGSFTPDVDVKVEVYEGYMMLRGWGGVEGYDLQIGFDDGDNITYITYFEDGVEVESVTNGYLSAFTGSDEYVFANLYIASGYAYATADEEGGYVLLSGYFYSENSSEPEYLYYYMEWGE